eukprot:CAMPEP_0176334778 /NCGR_PEP_ID=MMETSP0121_2-20121125/78275_1 /TAXON_ID=160619 /ORGANISM="Kryptoperidinium foliaceum, Strain CCMP 1326" /LENGTH=54 /DNA_ID=CAMNT_0017677733 /DNA_START=235 /DNA_END=396 /DNA_ORIENTATION=-
MSSYGLAPDMVNSTIRPNENASAAVLGERADGCSCKSSGAIQAREPPIAFDRPE